MDSPDPLDRSPLGKPTAYADAYAPELLFPIPRRTKREELGVSGPLPFRGFDLWTAYELSWLNEKGMPSVAMAEFRIPCDSPRLIESKSLKLYLNSFAMAPWPDDGAVRERLEKDLSAAAGSPVAATFLPSSGFARAGLSEWEGVCLDDLDISASRYRVAPDLLAAGGGIVEERLHTHLLRSNCPVTDQPDWGSVWFHYVGRRIDREGLLKYVISFREHREFHEHCVERMFVDIRRRCGTERLSVYARYTRRGGLEINPFRSDFEDPPENVRLARQ